MILPFIAVIVTPFVCSRADRKRSHRFYFILALLLTALTIVAYTFLPLTMRYKDLVQIPGPGQADGPTLRVQQYEWFGAKFTRTVSNSTLDSLKPDGAPARMQSKDQSPWPGPWIFFCINTLLFELALAVATCLSDSFAVLQAEESGTSFGQIILWGTFGWAISALLLGYINQLDWLPRLLPGLLLSGACIVADLLLVVLWPKPADFKLDTIPIDAARSLTGSSSSGHREPSDYQPSNEANLINLGTELALCHVRGGGGGGGAGPIKVRKRKLKSPVELLAEAKELNREPDKQPAQPDEPFGSQKSVDPYTSRSGQRSALDTVIDTGELRGQTGAASNERQTVAPADVETASLRVQLRLFLLILARRQVLIRYLLLFVLSGFFMSMHWNYFFLYLEHEFAADFTLVSALSMVGQSLLGELPFFILSRVFIARLGRSHTLSVSLISMGLRFLIYRFLLVQVSMWCVFLADCLQGPNYGLFYVVMTEVGLEYSYCDEQTIARLARTGLIDAKNGRQVDAIRLALRSTVQSVAFACYEGLGVGLGSLVGGLLLAHYDFHLLWLSMAVASIAAGLSNVLVELLWRERGPDD